MRDSDRESGVSERPRLSGEPKPRVSDAPRAQIGPYQVIAKIGEGGMGTVWLTKLPGLSGFNKVAVVKELRGELAGAPAFVEMFLNEARLAARLTHPNVVHTYGADQDNARMYIAMEYLDGQPWSAVRHVLWNNRSLPLALHLKVLADTLHGLHYAHEVRDYDGTPLDVVHRDMSPQNVFVTYDGQVKIVDFGVARAVISQKSDDASSALLFVGKIAYSSPEQLRGDAVDRRGDVYAVGVMLWEALAGRRLMEGLDRSEALRRAREPAPRIRELVPSTPRVLADICDRALSVDPAERFSTAAEFRSALLAYLTETAADIDESQLAVLVTGAFSDERARIHGLIEKSLAQRAPVLDAVSIDQLIETLRPPPGPAEHTLAADLSELASVTTLEDEAQMREASQVVMGRKSSLGKRQKLMAAGAALCLLLCAVIWFGSTSESPTVISKPLPVAPAGAAATNPTNAPAPAAAPAQAIEPTARDRAANDGKPVPASVVLKISAQPAGAVILLDGTPLANPFSGELKSDGELHMLRVSARGMQSQERVIELNADKTLTLTLLPRAARADGALTSAISNATSNSASDTSAGARMQDSSSRPMRPKAASTGRGDLDFDSRITHEAKARPIDEEDPYR